VAPLRAVVGCITAEGFVTRYSQIASQQTASFQDGFAILMRRTGDALKLELYHRYAVTRSESRRGPWTASTAEYIYEVSDQTDDLIAAFHWHPVSAQIGDEARWPHVHAYGARDTITLHKLHLPTGRVSLEAIVRFLIVDLDVRPRRSDWERILEQQEQAFRRTRSWS